MSGVLNTIFFWSGGEKKKKPVQNLFQINNVPLPWNKPVNYPIFCGSEKEGENAAWGHEPKSHWATAVGNLHVALGAELSWRFRYWSKHQNEIKQPKSNETPHLK